MTAEFIRSILEKFEENNQLAADALKTNLDRQNRGLAGLPVNWDDDEAAKGSAPPGHDPDSPTSTP